MKKIYILLLAMIFTTNLAFADFKEYFDNGQNYMTNYQYSSAISEFKKALRINYLDNSARIALVNAYLARATHYANTEHDYEKAANDFRSALFYLKYYPDEKEALRSAEAIATTIDNLEQCMVSLNQSKIDNARFQRASNLRKSGEFAAAAYEFFQSSQSSNVSIKSSSFTQIGDIMTIVGNDKKAVIYYQKSLASNPNNTIVRLRYARILDKLNQYDLAVQEYNSILSSGNANEEVLYALEKIYTKKLEENPNNAEVNANLGAILQKEKKYDEALNYYKKAESLNPSSVTTRLNIGTLYQQKQDFASALSAYNSILVLYPNNLEANLYKAQALSDMGDDTAALQGYKKVLTIDPTNVVAKKNMLSILKKTMTPTQMLAYLSTNSGLDASSIDAMYDYAKELHKANKTAEAIEAYSEVIKHKPSPEIYVNLALAYTQNKDYETAQKVLQDGLVKYPANSQLTTTIDSIKKDALNEKYAQASKYFTDGEFQKALDIYLTLKPATSEVLIGIAACYKSLNDINHAIEYYKRALALDSKNSDIAYYIGVLYAEIENWTAAKIYLQKALAINPNNKHAEDLLSSVIEQNNVLLINKVITKYNEKQYDEALRIISQVLTEDKTNSYAYYYRGLIYDAQNKLLQAIEEYKKAYVNNSELVIANYLIATAYDSLGQYQNALTYYKQFVKTNTSEDEYKKYAVSRITTLKNYEK